VGFDGALTQALVTLRHEKRLKTNLLGHLPPRRKVETFLGFHDATNGGGR
jgi:hypothetical protein